MKLERGIFLQFVSSNHQDMRICNSQPTDDHRRVSTVFRALHTDNQAGRWWCLMVGL